MRTSTHAVLRHFVLLPAVLLAMFSAAGFAQAQQDPAPAKAARAAHGDQMISQDVRHQLLMLPWYSVFDDLEYKVANGVVTLQGQVVQDVTRDDAGKYVKSIEGVTKVINNIEILPASPDDDRIRRAEFRAILGEPQLEKYSFGSVQPIHIIVKGGHVTLEGSVLSDGDKNLANIRANGVPGVFSVTNNLRVENSNSPDQRGQEDKDKH